MVASTAIPDFLYERVPAQISAGIMKEEKRKARASMLCEASLSNVLCSHNASLLIEVGKSKIKAGVAYWLRYQFKDEKVQVLINSQSWKDIGLFDPVIPSQPSLFLSVIVIHPGLPCCSAYYSWEEIQKKSLIMTDYVLMHSNTVESLSYILLYWLFYRAIRNR